jgi:two-component system nitrogen regulation sensor histidine kinase NtrY
MNLFPRLWTKPRFRWIVSSIIVCALLLIGTRVWESAARSAEEKDWARISEEASRNALKQSVRHFEQAQDAMLSAGRSLAGRDIVIKTVSGGLTTRVPAFSVLEEEHDATGFDVELYDREGELVAWHGDAGEASGEILDAARTSSYSSGIVRTPLASRLIVSVAMRDSSVLTGWLVVSRIASIDVPLKSTVLRQESIADDINRETNGNATFTFGAAAQGRGNGPSASAPLLDLEGKVFGSVSVDMPVQGDVLGSISRRSEAIERLLGLVEFLLVVLLVYSLRPLRSSSGLRTITSVGLLWLGRYLLLWLDLPGSLLPDGVFHPGAFASPFAGGLARSPGDLGLTVAAVVATCLLCAKELLPLVRSLGSFHAPLVIRYAAAGAVAVMLFWILRGFAAAVRSGVYDSPLAYLDARSIYPEPVLAVLISSFLLLGGCVLLVAVLVARWLVSLLAPAAGPIRAAWVGVGLLFCAAAIAFAVLTENPLIPLWYQLAFALIVPALARWFLREQQTGTRHVMLLLALGGVMAYALFDTFGQEKDRTHLEMLAADQLQSVDGWLQHVVDEGLQGFDTDENRARLSEGYGADVTGIAFRRWATSLACSQGYDALFVVDDPTGREASRFVIGSSVGIMNEVLQEMSRMPGDTVIVRNMGRGVNAEKVYAGSIALRAPDSLLLGYGRVVVAAGRQSFFRGETPGLLRSDQATQADAFYRQIFFSEYHDGSLLTSTNPALPVNHPLPDQVGAALADSARTALWSTETVGGDDYETYYIVRPGKRGDIVAVGMRAIGIAWIVVGFIKVLLVTLALAAAWLLVRGLGRGRTRKAVARSFRFRLLTALLITAFIPLTMVVVSVELAERERAMDDVKRLLEEEIHKVLFAITEHPQPGVTVLSLPPTREAVEDLASDIETDFNVYTDRDLRASSRQILYDAGFLDSRLDGSVYVRIVLGGERFVMQDEYLGGFKYTAGYRPILDARGDIIGVVSVPTLFHPQENEQYIARRIAFLLGAYISILVAVVVLASLFSGRIAAPLQRLTAATRRVASGDLDVRLPSGNMEGEIGELTSSFDQMVGDLRRMRDDQARVERELAWKEMAQQIAHEIKNPLTPMRLSVQHLRRTWKDGVPEFGGILEDVTSTVLDQIEALSRIASEFSRFAHMPRRNLASLDVAGVVGEAVQLFAQEERISFELHAKAGLPRITADQEELRRAFINVFRNAIQATEGTGRVVVELEDADGHVVVRITDFGRGIPDAIKARVFEPRFSTKTEGMGLGLAIVKKSVDDMGGSISLESVEGQGTIVTFRLPASAEGDDRHG